ncbi:hypothetical protein LCGC14_1668880 [marine sediment metagenome]|uniref:Uncharacterized protein n=1 Tax=marine sediment metagenome TaxID=412755 RepID=A0A0F9HSS9_9ZZZZ
MKSATMKSLNTRGILTLVGVVIGVGYYLTQPRNFDDCTLKYLKDAQTARSAVFVIRACRSKFPPTPPPEVTYDDFLDSPMSNEDFLDAPMDYNSFLDSPMAGDVPIEDPTERFDPSTAVLEVP